MSVDVRERLAHSIRLLAENADYPVQLRQLSRPPALYVRGEILVADALAIAIVGSRRASPYGLAVAERLAADLAARGVTIVSGLARGIDTAAHRGALSAGGRTLAVLGCGIDRIYPSENHQLAARIAEHGAVISQFEMGAPPLPGHFPERNQVIAGLALGTVVVEAAESSGALITAGIAGDLGRLVCAVPGSVTSATSRGANGLLRDGATLVRDWLDVVHELPTIWRDCVSIDVAPAALAPACGDEAVVLRLLDAAPADIESLIELSGLGSARTTAALTGLEISGWIRAASGRQYARVR